MPSEAQTQLPEPIVGRLLAVSVGVPRDVAWQGRTVRTAVWKRPVAGAHIVRRLNIDGDGQGDLQGHGGPHRAVLVYQVASYAYWRAHFGRDDLEYGNFGENFTVEGLADDTVCIGDRLAIGTAVFEVSQPRVTCYRVGLRLGEPTLPALLVSHRRPGFYLRVLDEGVVEAGDAIRQVGSGAVRMSVADVDALLYLPGHDRDDVAVARTMPALSPGWRDSFEAILGTPADAGGNAGLAAVESAPPAWAGFRSLLVAGLVRESATIMSVRIASVDAQALPAPLPGQYVALSVTPAGAESAVIRNYSLSGDPAAEGYRISVKLEPHGRASTFVHHQLDNGVLVKVAAPRGRFTLDNGHWPVLLISAGIGITPVLAMLHTLARSGNDRVVWWLHGARNSAEHAFAREVDTLLQRLPHVRTCIAYSAPLAQDELGRDFTSAGRITGPLLAALDLPVDSAAYVCGPAAFMTDVTRALTDLGLLPAHIHSEGFGPAAGLTPGIAGGPVREPHVPAGAPGSGAKVVFARSGLSVRWRADFGSVLELAEACDVPTRWSCRSGVCHNCESGLLAGSVRYDPTPIDLPGPGSILICCATPERDLVLDL